MADESFSLIIDLDARKAKREADGFGRSLDGTSRKAKGLSTQISNVTRLLGGLAVSAIAFRAIRIFSDAIKTSIEYQTSLVRINTLVGIQIAQVQRWSAEIDKISRQTGRLGNELAQALFVVTSAGQRGAEAIEILNIAAQSTQVGLGQTAAVARTVTSAMNAYGAANLSAAQAGDVLLTTIREGNLEAASLAPVLGNVIGVAAKLGVSFADVGAFIAAFTQVGVDAATSVTSLSALLISLLSPTKETAKALGELGLTAEEVRRVMAEEGLAQAIDLMTSAAAGNVEALGRLIPEQRALRGVLAVTGEQMETYLGIQERTRESTGNLAEAVAGTEGSAEDSLNKLSAAIDSAKRSTDVFLPALTLLVAGVTKLVRLATFQEIGERADFQAFAALFGGGGLAGTIATALSGGTSPEAALEPVNQQLENIGITLAEIAAITREIERIEIWMEINGLLDEQAAAQERINDLADKHAARLREIAQEYEDATLAADKLADATSVFLDELDSRIGTVDLGAVFSDAGVEDAFAAAVEAATRASDELANEADAAGQEFGDRFGAAAAAQMVVSMAQALSNDRRRMEALGRLIGGIIGGQIGATVGAVIGGLLDAAQGGTERSFTGAVVGGQVLPFGLFPGGSTRGPISGSPLSEDPSEGINDTGGAPAAFAEAQAALVNSIRGFEEAAGVIVQSTEKIRIDFMTGGEHLAFVGDTLVGSFGSLQEAIDAALSFALQSAEIVGASEEVRAAIATFSGGDFQKLLEMVEFARTLGTSIASLAGVGAVGQLASVEAEIARLREGIKALGLAAELETQRLEEVRQAAQIARAELRAGFLGRLFGAAEKAGILGAQQRARLEQLQLQIAAKRLELEAKALGLWNEFVQNLVKGIAEFAADIANFIDVSTPNISTGGFRISGGGSRRRGRRDERRAEQERLRDFLIGLRTQPGGGSAPGKTALNIALRAAEEARAKKDIDDFIKFAGQAKDIARGLFGQTAGADAVVAAIEAMGLSLADQKTFNEVQRAFYGDNVSLLRSNAAAQERSAAAQEQAAEQAARSGRDTDMMVVELKLANRSLKDIQQDLSTAKVDLRLLKDDTRHFHDTQHPQRVNQIVGANQGTKVAVDKAKVAIVDALG